MPTPSEILAGLTAIANDAVLAAVLWHLTIAMALVWVASGWHPTRRLATLMLAAPLASVGAFALAYGNPFNGFVFLAATAALVMMAAATGATRVRAAASWSTTLGVAMIAFAWAYPHFVEARSSLVYLFAAPVGLVPCPSIALAIGFALLAGGVDRRVAGVLASLGAAYGLLGVGYLGVLLDIGLLVGAGGLAAFTILPSVAAHRTA
jgi:hypothetical protein